MEITYEKHPVLTVQQLIDLLKSTPNHSVPVHLQDLRTGEESEVTSVNISNVCVNGTWIATGPVTLFCDNGEIENDKQRRIAALKRTYLSDELRLTYLKKQSAFTPIASPKMRKLVDEAQVVQARINTTIDELNGLKEG